MVFRVALPLVVLKYLSLRVYWALAVNPNSSFTRVSGAWLAGVKSIRNFLMYTTDLIYIPELEPVPVASE